MIFTLFILPYQLAQTTFSSGEYPEFVHAGPSLCYSSSRRTGMFTGKCAVSSNPFIPRLTAVDVGAKDVLHPSAIIRKGCVEATIKLTGGVKARL